MSKRIVIPGEQVSEERKRLGSHVYLREGKICSDCVGLYNEESNVASVVPLEGKYIPLVGDTIIGIVESENYSGYHVDVNAVYPSFISKKDIREILKPKSVISARVDDVQENMEIKVSGPRVFAGGELFTVSPVRIPRVIGRDGSMLNVLREGTGASILVGRNGRVWAKGGNLDLLRRSLEKIESEAHLDNLTDRMTAFLGLAKKNN
ncbi:MAG: hypothetical protein HY917_03785 [Candidatus Diapherotrites archaeon]|nr:hypothetical protein [Candidatus Diapherotrites archaeon]